MSLEAVLAGTEQWCVLEGEAAAHLSRLPPGSIDAVIVDPPSGIAFMGAAWDRDKGGRAQWVAEHAKLLALARAATRDGGRAAIWSLPRTSHWTGCAVEDAGWTIETTIAHLFGTGWPKGRAQTKPAQETWWLARTGRSEALNIEACRVTATGESMARAVKTTGGGVLFDRPWRSDPAAVAASLARSAESSAIATVAGRYPPNLVLSHAAGCVCEGTRRVATGTAVNRNRVPGAKTSWYGLRSGNAGADAGYADPDGTESVDAWACVEGCPVAELDRQSGERPGGVGQWTAGRAGNANAYGAASVRPAARFGDTGTASRYFPQFPADDPDAPWSEALFRYVAKPPTSEKWVYADCACTYGPIPVSHRPKRVGTGEAATCSACGMPAVDSGHPTVKSLALMRWLIRLTTKPGDVVLDFCAGSGTTGAAALLEGRRVILIERETMYADIARARCEVVRAPKASAPTA